MKRNLDQLSIDNTFSNFEILNVNGSLKKISNNELLRYKKIAKSLSNDKCVTDICKVLLEITSRNYIKEDDETVPFIFLDGSSGSGKSQMGFSIFEYMHQKRSTFYLLFNSDSNSQRIYLNFKNISILFNSCYKADAKMYNESNSPSTDFLFTQRLFLYGFIHLLISNPDQENVSVTPKTGEDIVMLMKTMKISDNRPVFIIDECIAVTDTSLKKIRFVRNCFRSLGLGLVMLGTDSKAAELASMLFTNNHSRKATPENWCYVFGKFPAVKIELLNLQQDHIKNLPEWFSSLLKNSRPLFSRLISSELKLDFFTSTIDFDVILSSAFGELLFTKNIFNDYFGKLGQVSLFLNSNYDLPCLNLDSDNASLINSHFAKLKDDKGSNNFILMSDGRIRRRDDVWVPSSRFPVITSDALLYLLLMGGKYHFAFQKDGEQVPYSWFLMNIQNDRYQKKVKINYDNAIQKSNDGMFLESLLCSSICIASHSNGLIGIPFKLFLTNLLYQLQYDNVEIGLVSLDELDLLKRRERPDKAGVEAGVGLAKRGRLVGEGINSYS